MTGRITSYESPFNANGIHYRTLLEMERRANARLVRALHDALREWLAADDEPPNSLSRRRRMAKARILTERAIR